MVLQAFIDGHKLPQWQGISKMLSLQADGLEEYLSILDEDMEDFVMYLAGINVV